MFNVELFKSNIKYILISIVFIILFALLNIFLNDINVTNSKLNDEKTSINKLVISEIMTSNKGAFVDSEGELYDWLEIYNGSNQNVNLENYGLSDADDGKVKWIFPSIELKSHEYLIVYLPGEKMEGLYADFSLKQEGGETITLKRDNGKVIDSVKTLKMQKNSSMIRNSDGEWTVTNEITPGYENSKDGREKFLSNFNNKDITYPLALTEFLPSNEGNVLFNGNKLYSYVEVTNISDEIVELDKYFLSNNEELIYKWRFPKLDLLPGESYLVYMNSIDKDNNASFNLKNKSGILILSTYSGIVENVKYEDLTNGVAYIKNNNKWNQNTSISPGYPNTTSGILDFSTEIDSSKEDLIISEVMSSNNKFLAQNGNQFYDWIEFYNNSSIEINLSDYSITTDSDDKYMYKFKEKKLGPGEYYVIMASGDVSLSNSLYDHANFKLSSGKGVFLYRNEELIDAIYIYSIPKGYSYGRSLPSGHYYYSNPTPNEENDKNGIRELAYEPTFSMPGGLYSNSSIELSLESNGDIYYTLDGSEPSNNSAKYKSPISIDKNTVVRAVTYANGVKNSDVITNSYILDEHSIPVVSVTLNTSDFNIIKSNTWGRSDVPAHVELYEDDSSFSIDCRFKLFGNASRDLAKKSFALKFKPQNLHYKVFDNKDIINFNTLVLRGGSQDYNVAMLRDEFVTSMAINHGTLDAQANKPVALYINGDYNGLYYLREKIDDDFIEDNYNVAGPTNIVDNNNNPEEGSNYDFVQLRNYVASHDMSNNNNYEYVSSILDIDNYIDFWVFQFIVNNTDLHNHRYYNNPNIANGKIRMILFDFDYSLHSDSGAWYLSFIQSPSNLLTPVNNVVLRGLMNNQNFRKRFIERIAYNIKNVWTVDNINTEFDKLYNSIKEEMHKDCLRWNISYDNWNNEALKLKDKAIARISQVINATKNYFNLSEEEINEYFY